MRPRIAARWLLIPVVVLVAAGARPGGGSIPPGRQYLLTIDGLNTVTFLPQAELAPFQIDYKARVEYIVNTRTAPEVEETGAVKKKAGRRAAVGRAKKTDDGGDAPKVVGAVDVSVHSTEMRFRQNGQTVVESRTSRARFQGRFQPDAPVLSVSYNEAPPRLQEVLKAFDTPAATVLLDEGARVVDRRVRVEGPIRAIVETLLSIHTPIPRDAAFWEAPTQLAMGHGQTAKGTLRFEKQKEAVAASGGLVKVKVSGVLKAEGVVAGRFIKDGTYTVSGEQSYDPASREWKAARWSVAVNNELANPNGVTVAHARGEMLVESKALDDAPAEDPVTKP